MRDERSLFQRHWVIFQFLMQTSSLLTLCKSVMAYISLAWFYSRKQTLAAGESPALELELQQLALCGRATTLFRTWRVCISLTVYFITASPSLYNNTSLWLYDATWREVIAGEEAYCLSLIERNSSSAYWMRRFFICFKALRSDFTQIVSAFGTRFLDRRLLHAQKSDTTQVMLLNLE